jgi:hypothetical protein
MNVAEVKPVEIKLDPPQFIDILAPLKDFLRWIVEQLYSLAQSVFKFVSEKVIAPLTEVYKWVADKIIGLFRSMFDAVLGLLKSITTPATPEKVYESVPTIMSSFMFYAFNPSLILAAMGVAIMGTKIDVSPISDTMNRLFNPEIILSFTIGAIFGMAIKTPLEYWAKRYFRPIKPDPLTLFGLYTRGYITREVLKSELAYVTGYPDTYINGLIDIFEYNPSLFDLLRFADFVELSDEFIEESLRILGVKGKYKDIIKTLIKKRPLREEVRTFTRAIISAYAKGFIPLPFLREGLSALEIGKAERKILEDYATFVRNIEITEERIFILRTAFQKGLISEATLISELTKLGLQKEWINLIVERGKLFRKIEVPVPKISRAFAVELPITTSYTYTIS